MLFTSCTAQLSSTGTWRAQLTDSVLSETVHALIHTGTHANK
jgi:hypothetical protein